MRSKGNICCNITLSAAPRAVGRPVYMQQLLQNTPTAAYRADGQLLALQMVQEHAYTHSASGWGAYALQQFAERV